MSNRYVVHLKLVKYCMSAVIEKHILKKHSEITKTTTTKIRKTWGQIDCTKDTNH